MSVGDVYPVILAGGGGTRLWPLSRSEAPKQFLNLTGERSLLQETVARVSGDGFAAPLVICNAEHRFRVAEQLREANCAPSDIVLEPHRRNTAPAACIAALVLSSRNPEALLLFVPSDHTIARPTAFRDAVQRGVGAARQGWLVTFAMKPTKAETAYGYIKTGRELEGLPGCHRVDCFVEKPDQATAEEYLAEGDYAWNSGIFLMPARTLLQELEALCPEVVAACRGAVASAVRDLDFLRLSEEAFAPCPAISIDHGVMEHTQRAAVVPAELEWNDVGSWSSLWEVLPKDAGGNVSKGDVEARDARDCLFYSDGSLLVAQGVADLVVVATEDAVLVCRKGDAQNVGRLAEVLRERGRDEASAHNVVFRPWGSYRNMTRGDGFLVKQITVLPGRSLSLQRHRHRAEHWVIVAGEAEVVCNGETLRLTPNQSTFIPANAVHRLANPGDVPLHVIEVQTGDYLDENDIERLQDDYGRDPTG